MKVDYATIADRYDNDKYRLNIPQDEALNKLCVSMGNTPITLLDLACGTGNYLATQYQYFAEKNIQWNGLDFSEDMTRIARDKMPAANYIHHDAEKGLPFDNGSIDYLVNRYAFHHFKDKLFILDEIHRVLRDGGIFRLTNAEMAKTPRFWIYQYFPSAIAIDQQRCWPANLLFYELETRQFDVSVNIEHRMYREPISYLYQSALNKDASHFALLEDQEYQDGLGRLQWEYENHPDMRVYCEFAEIVCTAVKKSGSMS